MNDLYCAVRTYRDRVMAEFKKIQAGTVCFQDVEGAREAAGEIVKLAAEVEELMRSVKKSLTS